MMRKMPPTPQTLNNLSKDNISPKTERKEPHKSSGATDGAGNRSRNMYLLDLGTTAMKVKSICR